MRRHPIFLLPVPCADTPSRQRARRALDHAGDDDIARERRAAPRPTTPAPTTATSANSVMRKPLPTPQILPAWHGAGNNFGRV